MASPTQLSLRPPNEPTAHYTGRGEGSTLRLLELPTELLVKVLVSLRPVDLCRLSQTCVELHNLVDQEHPLWRRLLGQTFRNAPSDLVNRATYPKLTFRHYSNPVIIPYSTGGGQFPLSYPPHRISKLVATGLELRILYSHGRVGIMGKRLARHWPCHDVMRRGRHEFCLEVERCEGNGCPDRTRATEECGFRYLSGEDVRFVDLKGKTKSVAGVTHDGDLYLFGRHMSLAATNVETFGVGFDWTVYQKATSKPHHSSRVDPEHLDHFLYIARYSSVCMSSPCLNRSNCKPVMTSHYKFSDRVVALEGASEHCLALLRSGVVVKVDIPVDDPWDLPMVPGIGEVTPTSRRQKITLHKPVKSMVALENFFFLATESSIHAFTNEPDVIEVTWRHGTGNNHRPAESGRSVPGLDPRIFRFPRKILRMWALHMKDPGLVDIFFTDDMGGFWHASVDMNPVIEDGILEVTADVEDASNYLGWDTTQARYIQDICGCEDNLAVLMA